MKRILLGAVFTAISLSSVFAQECDCKTYPFKPERCFNDCVKKLSARPPAEIDRVRDIDPGVSLSLRVLSQNRAASTVDLTAVQDKPALERAALSSLREASVKKGTAKRE